MSKRMRNRVALCATSMLGLVAAVAGCEPKGPAQKAGEDFDKGVQSAKDAINRPGPVEKAGRGVDKALNR